MFELKNFQKWMEEKEIIKYPKSTLDMNNLPLDIINILVEAGLPHKVEPSLWFLSMDEGALTRLDKFYVLDEDEYDFEFIESKKEYLKNFVVLGKSSGNAICLNEKNQIVCIDYEDFTESFVNETLEQLLECIICFDKLVKNIYDRHKGRIYYYDYVTEEDILTLKKELCNIVNDSLDKYDFWNINIEFLEEQIE